MRPSAIDARIASAVGSSTQTFAETSSARFACGWSRRTCSKSLPSPAAADDSPTRTSATSLPSSSSSVSNRSASVGSSKPSTRYSRPYRCVELRGDVLERVFIDRDQDGERACHPAQPTVPRRC